MSDQPTSPNVPDEIDRTFSDFFKGQLPSAWPACRATAPVVPSNRLPLKDDRDFSGASRAALAASVALLLGLGFYFSSGPGSGLQPRAGKNGELLNKATANGAGLLNSATPAEKRENPIKDFPKINMP